MNERKVKKETNSTFNTQYSSLNYHIPVLFNESIDALNIKPNGIYVDCTFGGGGHSKGILQKLGLNGKLFAFDQDADAQRNVLNDERFVFIPHNFRHLQRFLRVNGVTEVDGVLADLGVSSHQFDEGSRGFSTRFDGPFDMRMSVQQETTAASIITTYTEQKLHKMFEQYGEVSNAKTLAKHIVQQRKQVSLQTIQQFKSLIAPVVKGNPNKYLAQVFQALRMEVNQETEALKEMLQQLPIVLKKEGRAAIITFHSIEDRLVKNFFKRGSFDELPENPFVTEVKEKIFNLISKKPITANTEEVKRNTRSRSAKLRVVEKV
ncbi:MAG: 16S rRNA (cytosine(1402)-N(4))-methyltransferase RsmH [Bacteroidetes bacterium]|nr:16S rRNA (cytosine(1402)-N(4))-methyltransferase RsmH [Bacteroidota bacterium]MBS1648660.1 16S rRNA (cytosine(1402)-N(4))-methyltransferase RsmH [Bacteroidota bacterium]